MNQIKMIALDLDGTLFNDEKRISRRNRDTIKRAIEQGVVVLPCTGRHLEGLPEELKKIPGMKYAATSNGAAVFDLETRQLLVKDCLPGAQAVEIVATLKKEGAIPEIYMGGVCYAEAATHRDIFAFDIPQVIKDYVRISRHLVDDLPQFMMACGEGVEKIHCMFDRRRPETRQHAFEVMKHFDHVDVSAAFDYNLEVTTETINKGQALIDLGKLLGIKREEIMACGDGGNDYKMLQAVGFAVAMDNASDEIKAIADYVTLSNNDDGVAYAIEKFVLDQ